MRRTPLPSAFLLLALASAIAAPVPVRGSGPLPDIRWGVHEETLPNGLKVLLLRDTRAPVITFMVWYHVGSRSELPGRTGLAHLLEHMMFKGTRKFEAKVFSNLIQRNGGRHNAFTSRDYTAYFERIAADRVEVSLELEADRMRGLLLDPQEFLLERNVVQEERKLRVDDNPTSALWESLRATAFQAHPYGNPIIGWDTDLQRLRVEEAKRFYDTHYTPNNAFIVAVGDFQTNRMMDLVRKHFGDLPRGPAPATVTAREPEQEGERRVEIQKPARLPYFAAAYHVPTYFHKDAYALDVLGEILGGSRASRLDKALQREKRLVLSVEAGYPGLSIYPDLFAITAQPAPGVKVEQVEQAIAEQIEMIQKEPPGPEELARVKRRMATEYIIGLDSQFYRAMSLGRAEIAGSWKLATEYPSKIEAVSAADVQRVARTYLVRKNRTVGILKPLPLDPKQERRRPVASSNSGDHIR